MSSSASVALPDPTSASETVITNALTVMTNEFSPGQRFKIQRYQADVGEYLEEPNERHLIVQILDSAWAERRGVNGSWAPFVMERGSLALVPSGPVPEARLLTPCCSMILCALEENFTREIAQEIEREPAKGTNFNVRDT